MRLSKIVNIFIFLSFTGCAQKKLDRTLRMLNKESIPYIQVNEVISQDSIVFLDTRKIDEFEVSHLKNAIWVGYDNFEPQKIKDSIPDFNAPIVVYCSIGVRSEDIGEKLQKLGYTNIQNLYGGIFKWKNLGYPVFDSIGNETEKVHAYNKLWGKLLTKGEKVYD
ncbi:MAG: rhodanese-like domain-containing protein [Maribacter sp.]|nr:rhodanese-like domain-containing protein [Maribacter sp.]